MIGYNVIYRIPFGEMDPRGVVKEYKVFKTGFVFLIWRLHKTLIEGYVFDYIDREKIN